MDSEGSMPRRNQFKTNEEYNEWYRNYREMRRGYFREYSKKYNREWRKKNGYHNEIKSQLRYPLKQKARMMLRQGIQSGKVIRGNCEKCGNPNTHGHHSDYSKPLQVKWLCALHHTEEHKKNMDIKNRGKKLSDEEIEKYIAKRQKEIAGEKEKARKERIKRQYEMLKLYPALTLQEIGNKYGISRERVRQIIKIKQTQPPVSSNAKVVAVKKGRYIKTKQNK